ncbi:MAG: restriction endonuclease [Gemmatimonadaceae bacterium]|nr:restriction endonuclease [Gemmatimonadaceae bacterium]
MTNLLYYGDNIDVLRRHVKDESVDLVYLDPPFNSARSYNVLFKEQDGARASAQIKAFEDTWRWDASASVSYHEIVEAGGQVSEVMQAFRRIVGDSDMLAYLAMMAPRLVELRRALKHSGSLYLHCDPTASHYLKLLLDAVFGPERLLNEITWKRSHAHSDTAQGMKRCGKIRDILLLYTKSEQYTWNTLYTPYSDWHLESEYRHTGIDGRRFKETDLSAAKPGGDVEYDWRVKRCNADGVRWVADLDEEWRSPRKDYQYLAVRPYVGRYWAYSKDNLVQMAKDGRLIHRETGMPRLMQFADEMPGIPLQDLWDDIDPINAKARERLGYPTQKPEALLDRIIMTSSNVGDLVLDPFCGCGTAIASAQRLERNWVGIDVTHLAINLIKSRLKDAHGEAAQFRVVGEPTTLADAEELARTDPYQFQWWALGLVGARPAEQKKGADKGIDGRLYFHDGTAAGKTKSLIISVKAGHVTVSQVRDLVGVLQREKAEIGVLISFEEPTKPMRTEAASAGLYDSPWGRHPRMQLLTVGELLEGKGIDYPRTAGTNQTFKQAPKAQSLIEAHPELFD